LKSLNKKFVVTFGTNEASGVITCASNPTRGHEIGQPLPHTQVNADFSFSLSLSELCLFLSLFFLAFYFGGFFLPVFVCRLAKLQVSIVDGSNVAVPHNATGTIAVKGYASSYSLCVAFTFFYFFFLQSSHSPVSMLALSLAPAMVLPFAMGNFSLESRRL
jgi:hypothetical protein